MNSLLLHAIQQGKLWDFHGGIRPETLKDQSLNAPLRRFPLAKHLILPLKQHQGMAADLIVKKGDYVLKGQPLTSTQYLLNPYQAVPIHAPTSGKIEDIMDYPLSHIPLLSGSAIHLIPDQKDLWYERKPLLNYQNYQPVQLIDKIHQAGIVGLGGAAFPTAEKLVLGYQQGIELLIINAAECEPCISADERLIQEEATQIVTGIQILRHILTPTMTIIAIEDNKPFAIKALQKALIAYPEIILRVIPAKYPSGSAKQLIKLLTGMEIPRGKHAVDLAILMQNIATTYAIKRAVIDDEPLIERVVTLTGDLIKQQGNIWVPFGTSIRHLLIASQYQTDSRQANIILGGPLMGSPVSNINLPMNKSINCLFAPTFQQVNSTLPEQNCIRCGQCANVCPQKLLPQQLYWYCRGNDQEKAQSHALLDCIECGACTYVCPSNIPLVQYYKKQKAQWFADKQKKVFAQQAKQRFMVKQQRLLNRQQNRFTMMAISDEQNQQIQAALARVKAKKAMQYHDATKATKIKESSNTQADAHLKRDDSTQLHKIDKASTIPKKANSLEIPSSNQKSIQTAAVNAAIERAKARKMALQQKNHLPPTVKTRSSESSSTLTDKATITERDACHITSGSDQHRVDS